MSMTEVVYNPYNFVNPIKDPKRFAGREKELKEIRYYLELSTSGSPIHIALVGPRSVGKRSLLNMIEYVADNELGLLAVKVPLNAEIVKNDVSFFKEIFDGILTKGAERGMYGGLSGKIYRAFRKAIDTLKIEAEMPLLFGTAYIGFKKENIAGVSQHVLIHDLRKIYSEAKEKGIPTIVLLFDECDLLSQNETLLQKIRNIFTEKGYILVFSGTEEMFPAISEVFSPIPRFFKRINVENFKEFKETEECLLKPLNDAEKEAFDRTCIADIHRISNGSPYEINLIAHYMYRRWREGKNPKIQLSPEVLDDVLNELERLRKEGHYEIANKIKRYWVDYLKILISLLEFPKVHEDWLVEYMLLDEIETIQLRDIHVRKSIIKDYIKYLKRDGMIAEEDGKILFKGDQFDVLYLKYLCASKDIRDTKEFFIGFLDDPLSNLHHKFVEGVLLKDFPEYHIHTGFDKREKFEEKTGQKFIIGARVNLPPGEHTLLEISPETEKEFYLGTPNSIRFRVNIEWMNEGFVTQIKFKNKDNLENFKRHLELLKEKLEFLGYEILFKDEISWNLEGSEYSKQGNMEKAMECFDKAIEINPSFELPWANKAGILFKLKKYDEALNCVNKALKLHPNWTEALKLKGTILINKGRNEEALGSLERASKINPEDWSVWDNLGRAYFNLKKYENALKCFDRALKPNPENHGILYLNGLSLANIGRDEEAINCLDKALELNPDFISALLAKGEILLNRSHYEEALNCCDKVLEKEEANIAALGLKAIVLSKLNRYEDAIKCCDKILEIDQNNALAWYNKACFKAKLGESDDALKCLEKAVEIDEKYVEIAKNEEDFSNLKDNKKFLDLVKKDCSRGEKNEY